MPTSVPRRHTVLCLTSFTTISSTCMRHFHLWAHLHCIISFLQDISLVSPDWDHDINQLPIPQTSVPLFVPTQLRDRTREVVNVLTISAIPSATATNHLLNLVFQRCMRRVVMLDVLHASYHIHGRVSPTDFFGHWWLSKTHV